LTINHESLRKILELERNKGFVDSVVIGGLDRFLRNWTGPAMESVSSPHTIARFHKLGLVNPDYASMNRQQRQEWVTALLSFISELDSKESTEIPVTPKPSMTVTPRPRPKKQVATAGVSLDSPITAIKGISAKLRDKLNKFGVESIRDLLYYFPNRHLDYSQRKTVSQLSGGEEETIVANVWQAQETRPGGRKSTEAIVGDETGNVRVVWFNNPYLARTLKPNMRIVLSGRVKVFNGRHVFESPEWEPVETGDLIHTGRLVPIYPLTQGLYQRQIRKIMKGVVDQWAEQLQDFLPGDIRKRCNLLELPEAIYQAHYPDDETLKKRARIRLAFDELLLLQLGVLNRKREWQEDQPGVSISSGIPAIHDFLNSLPFKLTNAQQKVINEIAVDIEKTQPMSRLLQGEVGSGKTVVATAGLLASVANGYQAALMAPTEILAEQHFSTICRLLSDGDENEEQGNYLRAIPGILSKPINVALLTGSTTPSAKQQLHRQILDGEVNIVIGTHALIQKEVEFAALALAVVDEQHRFGVEQRSILRQKGSNPHVLVMTATPIPRTLALTLYGDLDISVIDELPPGRQTIKTRWLKPAQRESAYTFIRREVSSGRQAFIICPLVEESDVIQAKAATAEYEHLSSNVFPELKLGLLHGRMSAKEKEKTMKRFQDKKLDILVSTPVIEVGIDVPNATVMMVESADRFGLSQLHQFRGRVGRGPDQSYCMLMAQNPSEIGRARLDIIEKTQDGFKLAEEDLKLRGPGEFFGTRQSGIPDLRMAKLSDVALLEQARSEAEKIFQKDHYLNKPEHALLIKEMARVWTGETAEKS